ncbi:ABC transporter permease [Actibacterium mucosum]|uniref:ABC transporter permease n=1 Tax=Actibacterium mucosum TaxID=1087332 RepID=UPI001377CA39|nr:ABC transporter permease [Actibacterium mucosum]
MTLVILVMVVSMTFASPYFASWLNAESILLGMTVEGMITIGMVILLVSGGLDLSVGSTVALGGVATGLLLTAGVPVPLAIGLGLSVCAMVGLVNGVLIAFFDINPFIGTLGMLLVVRGIVLIISGGQSVLNLPESFTAIGQSKLFGLQFPIIFLLVLTLVWDVVMRNSRFMRQSYYVGANEKAARVNGINVELVKVLNYVIISVLAGAAGIFFAARLGTAAVTVGTGIEMKVITAAIIGGASLSGGTGTIIGAFLGALFMGILSNSLNLLGIDIYWQNFITGVTLILAILAGGARPNWLRRKAAA